MMQAYANRIGQMLASRRDILRNAVVMAAAAPLASHVAYPATPSELAVKIVHFFARKRGLTPKQFVDYWLHVHGPMTLKIPWAI